MKITVKMKDDTVVICSKCHWSGAIEDAHWMENPPPHGYCPACGSSEFDDLETWEAYDDHWNGNEITSWEWTGQKAVIAVYALMIGVGIFIVIPWGVGVYHIVRNWIY